MRFAGELGEAVDVGGEWLAEVSVVVDGPWVGLGAVDGVVDVGHDDAVAEEGFGEGVAVEAFADGSGELEHGARGLIEGALVERVLAAAILGVPDAVSALDAAALHFEDEDAVLGEEDEVDFGAALGFVVREAEGVEADPVLGVGGVADDFVHAALGVALDGGVDGGGEHAGHARRPSIHLGSLFNQPCSW